MSVSSFPLRDSGWHVEGVNGTSGAAIAVCIDNPPFPCPRMLPLRSETVSTSRGNNGIMRVREAGRQVFKHPAAKVTGGVSSHDHDKSSIPTSTCHRP